MTRNILFGGVLLAASGLVLAGFARVGEWVPAVLAGLIVPACVAWEWVKGIRGGGEARAAGERLVLYFTFAMFGTLAALHVGG